MGLTLNSFFSCLSFCSSFLFFLLVQINGLLKVAKLAASRLESIEIVLSMAIVLTIGKIVTPHQDLSISLNLDRFKKYNGVHNLIIIQTGRRVLTYLGLRTRGQNIIYIFLGLRTKAQNIYIFNDPPFGDTRNGPGLPEMERFVLLAV